jgi:hypothetical protein
MVILHKQNRISLGKADREEKDFRVYGGMN